jgi:hypothetical protein
MRASWVRWLSANLEKNGQVDVNFPPSQPISGEMIAQAANDSQNFSQKPYSVQNGSFENVTIPRNAISLEIM